MSDITNPHDKLFKEALTQPDAARTFLRDCLPAEVAALLDLSRLQLVKDSFVDESLQEHFSDLLYEVGLRDNGSAYVCVLFEHKSYVDPLVALKPYVPDYQYALYDLSAYSDAEIARTEVLGIGLLVLKHIYRPDLRARLPEVVALW